MQIPNMKGPHVGLVISLLTRVLAWRNVTSTQARWSMLDCAGQAWVTEHKSHERTSWLAMASHTHPPGRSGWQAQQRRLQLLRLRHLFAKVVVQRVSSQVTRHGV